MRTRIVIGAGAWLLGAAAATAGSLLVVSELGEGISAPPGQQSTVAAAEQAQASQPAARPFAAPKPRPRSSTAGKSGTNTTSGAGGTGGAASTGGTVLASSGGTVVAQCAPAGAYLVSWSPQQGFQASSVARGPATTARVVFAATASRVTMVVSCASGTPTAATTVTSAVTPTATGDDNGGGGGGDPGPGGGGGGGDT
jgi:hypothetical protein